MPRATRSKKIVIAEDETDIALQIPLPESPNAKTRFVLREISQNPEPEIMSAEDAALALELKGLKAAYKKATGEKKTKKGKVKKNNKQTLDLVVIDDDEPAVVSPAIEGARQILSSDEEDLPSTKREHNAPPSPAVRATRQQLAKSKAGQFDDILSSPAGNLAGLPSNSLVITTKITSPSRGRYYQEFLPGQFWMQPQRSNANIFNHILEGVDGLRTVNRGGDVVEVTSPTRQGKSTLAAVEKACGEKGSANVKADDTTEDSFVGEITTRSPAKPVSRIEDSLEALDKMEDAIEALDQAANTVPSTNKAPSTGSSTDKMLTTIGEKSSAKTTVKPFASMRVKSQAPRVSVKALDGVDLKENQPIKKVKSSSALRDAVEVAGGKVIVAKKFVKRPSSLLPPKQPMKSTKPTTQSTFELPGEAVARKLKEQREARKAQREASEQASSSTVPVTKIKSAKLPTKSTFKLPGEAVSRKKREAHEARIRAQEEEEKKRREFKARPVRNSVAPDFVPRETAASLARKTQLGTLESQSVAATQPHGHLSVAKRGSIMGARRPSMQATALANSSAPRSPGPAASTQGPHARRPSTTSGPSMSGLSIQRTVSASEVQLQRQRAKEIYKRDMKALEEMEKEKREREAAAKKSRLEAAERGRQASREWAEKQRVKKAQEGDKGMAAGFGPGGQIGLSA